MRSVSAAFSATFLCFCSFSSMCCPLGLVKTYYERPSKQGLKSV
nr:MAG TPA: hypothetical protein [Caudoviricetes sp.]